MPFDAHFIRHAESAGNAGQSSEDPESIPLTPAGMEQAEVFAAEFRVKPSVFGISPFLRAQQTARPLLIEHPGCEAFTLPIEEFTYLAPGRWRGTNAAQRKPAVEEYWRRAEPDYHDGEGAESFAIFMRRADAVLRWLDAREEKCAVLVCHEIFIRAVAWRCLTPSLEEAIGTMWQFRAWQLSAKLPNVSVTRVSVSAEGVASVALPFSHGGGGRCAS